MLTELNIAYLDWLDANIEQHTFGLDLPALLGQPIAEYVAATLDKLCASKPPEGVFYVVGATERSSAWACAAHQRLGASEMKRGFVRPDQRGGGLGATIVRRLISGRDVVRVCESGSTPARS